MVHNFSMIPTSQLGSFAASLVFFHSAKSASFRLSPAPAEAAVRAPVIWIYVY